MAPARARRVAAVAALAAQRDVDAIALTTPGSVAATTGWPQQPDGYPPAARPLALVTAGGQVVLLLSAAARFQHRELGDAVSRVTFGASPFADGEADLPDASRTAAVRSVRRLLALGRLLVDARGLSGGETLELLAAGDVAVESLDAALGPILGVASADELDRLRELAVVHEHAAAAAARACLDGRSEREALDLYAARLAADGARHGAGILSTGRRAALLASPDGETRAADGLVRWDLACRRGLHWADSARTVLAPGAAAAARDIRARMVDAHGEVLAGIRAGRTGREVFAATATAWRRRGLPAERLLTAGHGINHELHGWPPLAAHAPDAALLEPGQVLCVEAACFEPDVGGFSIEDMVVVTATGCDRLTTLPYEEVSDDE